MNLSRSWAFACTSLGVVLLFADCTVPDNLDDRVWPCDESSPVNQCGTQNGKALACWQSFCVPTCDSSSPPPAGYRCMRPGVLLRECAPSSPICPAGLHCLRTDLVIDTGVCVAESVCSADVDCMGTVRNTCGSTLLGALSPDNPSLHADHLPCVQAGCKTRGSNCASGESCLYDEYPLGSLSDLCVPNCDASGNCPPSFSCAQSVIDPKGDLVCVPGVPGVRCTSNDDCIAGACVDTGTEFHVCSIPCTAESDCEVLNKTLGTYYLCVQSVPKQLQFCISPRPFGGVRCEPSKQNADCPSPEQCFDYNPFGSGPASAECRVPCGADGTCPNRGGLPHVCLGGGAGGCYPGEFGLDCTDSSQCLAPMQCLPAQADGRQPRPEDTAPNRMICTLPCTTDDDCQQPGPTVGAGYCSEGGAGKVCRPPAFNGAPCDRNAECKYAECAMGATCQCPAGATCQ